MSVVSVVCCQLEVSATSWSLIQRSPTDCGASLCLIYKPREWGGPDPLGVFAPKTNKLRCFPYQYHSTNAPHSFVYLPPIL